MRPSNSLGISIKVAMTKYIWAVFGTVILVAGNTMAQDSTPGTSTAPPGSIAVDNDPRTTTGTDHLYPSELPGGKISLVRGTVKKLDPVHDQILLHAFGGGDLKIAFDPRTKILPEEAKMRLTSLPVGTVISVDTVMENGKLFARSVRTSESSNGVVELNGKVVRYDAEKSRLILRDSLSPQNVTLRVTPSTVVLNQGKPSSTQALSSDMLVRVRFSSTQETASNIEILAKRGDSFAFEGRVIAVDLHSRTVALSNNTDQSMRELSLSSLDATSVGLLREGANVSIQAQFDGDQYNIRSVTLVTSKQ